MKNRAKILVHVFLAAVMVGQALFAVAAPCSAVMEPGIADGALEAVADAHAHHHGQAPAVASGLAEQADENVAAGSGCCDGGYCASSGCLSVPAIACTGIDTAIPRLVVAPAPELASSPSRTRSALFRPPAVA